MSLTGVTWLTGEVIDETRLNYMVKNTEEIKTYFTTGTSWGEAQVDALGWVNIAAWSGGQIIDSIRLNQMYSNQRILQSIVGSGVTVWSDSTEYLQDAYIDNDDGRHTSPNPYLTLDGNQFGPTLPIEWTVPVSETDHAITNKDISMYDDYSLIEIGLWFGVNGGEGGMVSNKSKFVKLPNMNYLSYWITVGKKGNPASYYRSNLTVISHNDFTNW